jgi:hypothetical protein
MGQTISVAAKRIDDFCVFTTDRVLTGQDGVRYESAGSAEAGDGFLALLAQRLFGSDAGVESVWVASSEVIVGRSDGWDPDRMAAAQQTITDLYRFYPPSPGGGSGAT